MPDLADIRSALADLLTAIDVADVKAVISSALVDEDLVANGSEAEALFGVLRTWSRG